MREKEVLNYRVIVKGANEQDTPEEAADYLYRQYLFYSDFNSFRSFLKGIKQHISEQKIKHPNFNFDKIDACIKIFAKKYHSKVIKEEYQPFDINLPANKRITENLMVFEKLNILSVLKDHLGKKAAMARAIHDITNNMTGMNEKSIEIVLGAMDRKEYNRNKPTNKGQNIEYAEIRINQYKRKPR